MNTNYVTCHMIGRIGNQMFQIANAYNQAKKHNRQLVLPRKETNVEPYLTNIYREIQHSFIIDNVPTGKNIYSIQGTFHYTSYTPHLTNLTVFRGFYQTEKYFIESAADIKRMYRPTQEFIKKAYFYYPQLVNNVAAINIRRGDYLNFPTRHPVVSLDYIYKAIEFLPKVDYYFIVSDDIRWCKENINLPNCIFTEFIDFEALWLLSLCNHFVISNSSFSWWGAYLSNNANKIVVAPDTWVGPDIMENMKDIWCENWIKIPTRVYNGYLELK